MDWTTLICTVLPTVIATLGGGYQMMKFLLKNIRKDLAIHEKLFETSEKAMRDFREEMRSMNIRMDQSMREQNARLDGLYTILINKK